MKAQTRTQKQDTPLTEQGSMMGMPYDFRKPTWEKMKARYWNPGGPMTAPKVWGAGWTLNLAHKGTWFVFAATAATIALLSYVG